MPVGFVKYLLIEIHLLTPSSQSKILSWNSFMAKGNLKDARVDRQTSDHNRFIERTP